MTRDQADHAAQDELTRAKIQEALDETGFELPEAGLTVLADGDVFPEENIAVRKPAVPVSAFQVLKERFVGSKCFVHRLFKSVRL